jgi:hypothetical protein
MESPNESQFKHTTITVDGRCLDLLLTEDEIATSFERSLHESNQKFINKEKCCSCWPVNQPPECPFWSKILGICRECDH